MLKWFTTHDGRMALLTLTMISLGIGVWHGVLLNRQETIANRHEVLENRRTTERNFEALQRLERLITEMGN